LKGLLRTILALLVAPVVPGLAFVALRIMTGEVSGEGEILSIALFSVLVGYPIAIILGIPLYYVLSWRGWNGLSAYVIAGGLVGGISILPVMSYYFDGWHGFGQSVVDLINKDRLWGIAIGVTSALSFWVIARPDKRTT
jgi:hypothetical protein